MNESPQPAKKPVAIWLVLVAAGGAFALTMGVRQSMGLFLSALNTSTALGVGSISLAFAFGQLWWGLTQPFVGAAADRIGAGRAIFIGLLLVAIGTFITPLMTTTAGLIFAIGMLGAGGAALVNLPIREAAPGRPQQGKPPQGTINHAKWGALGKFPTSRGRGTGLAGPQAQRPPRGGSAVGEATSVGAIDPRTRSLLEAPIGRTLLRLGAPNVVVMVAQASIGLIETYFVGKLGVDALAGMALVFPVVMLMQMTSAGAMGGGIASSIARALGARLRQDADALVLHAMLIAVGFGVVFSLALLLGARSLYAQMGGSGASLDAALTYSHWVFGGAILVWLFNSLPAVIRGAGNMQVPANVTVAGVVRVVPLSPLLIFGGGPVPALGIAGGAIALLLYYLAGSLALVAYLCSSRSLLTPSITKVKLRWHLFQGILRVGLMGSVSAVATNLSIGVATSLAGGFGPAAIAGYGTASRLKYLLVPLVFGLGAPLVAMVGTCMGAGQHGRALRATWIGAVMAFAMTEAIGLAAAVFPHAWFSLFGADPAMLEAGILYLRTVGPLYGFFGVGLVLYFASQGAGLRLWPVAGNIVRLAVAAFGGWLAIRWGGGLVQVFMAQAAALAVYGSVVAVAIAGGAWFGRVGWPCRTGSLLKRLTAGEPEPNLN